MLAVAAYEFRQAPPIRYEMELALISLLVESFSEHLCLDNHRGNHSKLHPKKETKYLQINLSRQFAIENFAHDLPFLALYTDVRKAHPCDVVPFLVKYKKSCHKMLLPRPT